ncbi:zf-HC2 domain-containing protein [bacterium]|nr:zf-HC2 domain-containing protein [candidate division CSSED10-310 bacterium]
MNCHQVREHLSAFIDKDLDSDQTNAIKAHLIRCSQCRQTRDQLEKIGHMIRQMAPLTAPADMQFRIYSSIRHKVTRTDRRLHFGWRSVFVPATAMIIGVFIGIWSDASLSPGSPVPMITSEHRDHADTTIQSDADIMLAGLLDSAGVDSAMIVDADTRIIRDYNLDRYVHQPMVPVSVDFIPDVGSDSGPGEAKSRDSVVPARSYVLDNVPMRVGYERTIY